MLSCQLDFFCGGCNKTTEALDWNYVKDLIAYASSHSVVLYKPEVSYSFRNNFINFIAWKFCSQVKKNYNAAKNTFWAQPQIKILQKNSFHKTLKLKCKIFMH